MTTAAASTAVRYAFNMIDLLAISGEIRGSVRSAPRSTCLLRFEVVAHCCLARVLDLSLGRLVVAFGDLGELDRAGTVTALGGFDRTFHEAGAPALELTQSLRALVELRTHDLLGTGDVGDARLDLFLPVLLLRKRRRNGGDADGG